MKNKILVVLSGGQDSTTCLYWAVRQYGKENVSAITFSYGQRHNIEVEAAKNICIQEGIVQHQIINVDFLKDISDSALIVGKKEDINTIGENNLPASFVPNRNQLFITIAHAFAQKIKADKIILGVCQTDFSGYPDCRQEFINAIALASNLGSGSTIEIITPLMYLSKAHTFSFAAYLDRLEDIINLTVTCYKGNSIRHKWGNGCGDCPACKLREKGYREFLEMSETTQFSKK